MAATFRSVTEATAPVPPPPVKVTVGREVYPRPALVTVSDTTPAPPPANHGPLPVPSTSRTAGVAAGYEQSGLLYPAPAKADTGITGVSMYWVCPGMNG